MNWIGSRWWKFDFHNHTPTSDDYGKGPNQAQYMQITHKDWLLNYMRQGIDCVAVTDHNSGVWIDPLKQALKELASESHEDYRPLYLFPGVELTVQGNIHKLFDAGLCAIDPHTLKLWFAPDLVKKDADLAAIDGITMRKTQLPINKDNIEGRWDAFVKILLI